LDDNDIEAFEDFHDLTLDVVDHVNPFNAYGEYHNRTVATHHLVEEEKYFDTVEYNDFDDLVDDLLDSVNHNLLLIHISLHLPMLIRSQTLIFSDLFLDVLRRILSIKRSMSPRNLPADKFPIL
jgi:hypothetical protein